MDNIGAGLLRARKRAGLTQGELAKLAGIDRATISLIENGHESPRADTVVRLAGALNVSPSEIWGTVESVVPGSHGKTINELNYDKGGSSDIHPGLKDLFTDERSRLMLSLTEDEEAMLRSIRTRSNKRLTKEFFIDVLVAYRRHRE